MIESNFVTGLMNTINVMHPDAVIIRPNDQMTLGIPDIMAILPPAGALLAIECKQLRSFLPDPFNAGRRTGPLLDHTFTGPQISMLRKLARAGAVAFGAIRVTEGAAYRIDPSLIPIEGNFTFEQLQKVGTPFFRSDTRWKF